MPAETMQSESPSRLVVGLIGGIGSGKSLAAEMFCEQGCDVIDADKIGHALLERQDIVAALVDRFGGDILDGDGRIDRQVLGERAFVDSASIDALNAVIHNPLRLELQRRIAELNHSDPPGGLIVVDAALLLETDWHELCDTLVFVDSPYPQRLQRVSQTRHWPEAELTRRENLQKTLDIKRARADHVLRNNSSVSRLQQQVCLLHQLLSQQ